MALVTYIIGDCPSCGAPESYGNVMVANNMLMRGCLRCKHWERVPLPELQKKVIYLDQFFFSHAFRGQHRMFVEAKQRITDLALAQQVVVPYSNLHEDESQLWSDEQRAPLLEFIKQTSLGHKFAYEFEVKIKQVHRAYEAFLEGGAKNQPVERADALRSDVNAWDGYVWINVNLNFSEREDLRKRKDSSVDALLGAFDEWAASRCTFEEIVRREVLSCAISYQGHFLQYVTLLGRGDHTAWLNSNENSMMIESLLTYQADQPVVQRLERIQEFFQSEYFANVPEIRIGSELFAMLRTQLQQGAYTNKEKNRVRFSGLMYDVRFISAYAPYCDAMVVDNLMFQWATDPLIDLEGRFGVRLFSRRNWSEFLNYLSDIATSQTPEVEEAIKLIRPPGARSPWRTRGSESPSGSV